MKDDLRWLAKPLALSLLLGLGVLAVQGGAWQPLGHPTQWQHWLTQHGSLGWPLLALGGVLFTAAGGPRQALALLGGALLGAWWGAAVTTLLTALGAMLTMALVRAAGTEWLPDRLLSLALRMRQTLGKDTWQWICVVRLLPVGSNLATNVAAALAGLRGSAVFGGSVLGYLPQMLLFSHVGAGVALQDRTHLLIGLGLLVGSSLLGLHLYHRRFRPQPHASTEHPHGHDHPTV